MTKLRLWLPVSMIAAAAYAGTGIGTPAAELVPAGPHPGRPECPHDWDFKQGQLALVGPNIDVPEFHDCQRFIVYTDTGPVYDSLYAIFAAAGLDTLDTTLARLDPTHTGNLAIAAAEVYAEGRYEQLGIRSIFSCLYLYRDTRSWYAKMVTIGRAERDCGQPVNPASLSGKVLTVRRRSLSGFYDRDIPPVARWDWDPRRHLQVVGIKCGSAWCEVGPTTGFATRQPLDLPASAGPKARRTRMIKGWFDEQFLSRVTKNGEVKPSTIWATIYPDTGLDDYDTSTVFKRGRWVHVADVSLTDLSGVPNPPNPYRDRLNLDFTHTGGPLDSLYLCRGTEAECNPHVSHPCDTDGQWWSRVVRASDGKPREMCEIRRPHDGLGRHVPGTARWRWQASDETTWQRCDNGCCELKS